MEQMVVKEEVEAELFNTLKQMELVSNPNILSEVWLVPAEI
jgi:hypothetical protein